MRRIIGAALLALVVGVAAAQDGPITIKLKKAGPGESVKETKEEKGEQKLVISVMGMNQTKTESGTSKFAFTDEVIEKPAGAKKPTKLKRTYQTAQVETRDEKTDLGLAGKTVLIEKKGDEYTFTLDGKPVPGKGAEILAKEFNKKSDTDEEAFLPKGPVKVGDTWKPDLPKLTKELSDEGMTVDAAKSTATATLKKVYKKGNATFGVIEVEMNLIITKVGPAGQEIPMKDGSKLAVKVELDGCIDGTTASGSSKMTMKGDLSGETMGVAISIGLNATNNGSSEEVKK